MADILNAHAANFGDRLAVIDDRPNGDHFSITYGQLDLFTNQLGHLLVSHGVNPGDRVVWCGQNSIGVVSLMSAARKVGATAVPLNYRLTDDEAAYVIDHCDAEIVYVDADFAPMLERVRGSIPKIREVLVFGGAPPSDDAWYISVDAEVASMPDSAPPEPPAETADGATMIYTSGTTGKPKGAFRRRATAPTQMIAMLEHIGYRADDVYLTTGPLYHSGPGGFMGIAINMGQTIVVQRKFNAEDWLRLVDKYRCSSTFSAPTPIRMICNLPDDTIAKYDVSSMRVMIANAAPWSFALKQQYLSHFPSESLFEVYGSTELGVNTILRPEDQLRKPGSCGKPSPMVEIRLYDDDGNIVEGTGPEHTGELFVRSPSVFSDYYKQNDKFMEDHRDGYQTVGDIAYIDEEGFVFICDRKKDMIISGGMNIYPAEIEAALEQHPGVLEAAVFGIPSEDWGETVHAVVVANGNAEVNDDILNAHSRVTLASYKVPRSFSWSDELPKTGSGKILKRELRQPYWDEFNSKI